jgi:hypothetical protein
MTDTGGYLFHKILHEARIAERQRELAAVRLARRNRKHRWNSMRLATARGLHKLAQAIEPAHGLRVPVQRKPA